MPVAPFLVGTQARAWAACYRSLVLQMQPSRTWLLCVGQSRYLPHARFPP